MSDCVPCTTTLAFSAIKAQNFGFITSTSEKFSPRFELSCPRNRRLNLVQAKAGKNNRFVLDSESYKFPDELGFKEKGEQQQLEFDSRIRSQPTTGNGKRAESGGVLDVLEFKGGQKIRESGKGVEEQDLVRAGDGEPAPENGMAAGGRRGRLLMRRSNLLAKQVISIQSARSLGFVSQIWVDTASWVVLVIEVRPNLLAGEPERFLLEDVSQVGDVILVEDETVLENESKKGCLDTLVGYRVMTPGRQEIGKVSTYALLVEDVLEVLPDTVVVHEAAASRIHRITKGFWDTQSVQTAIDEIGKFSENENSGRSNNGGRTRRRFGGKKFHPKTKDIGDDWELPIDYLANEACMGLPLSGKCAENLRSLRMYLLPNQSVSHNKGAVYGNNVGVCLANSITLFDC